MKSLRYTRVVVIADTVSGCSVMVRLRQMELSQVTAVAGLQQARAICRDGGADACLVIRHNSDFDDRPLTAAEEDAPGRATGVPSLLLADVVTPHLRKAARRAGYRAAVPAAIAPRLLYRRIGGALQQARRGAARRRGVRPRAVRPVPPAVFGRFPPRLGEFGKPTLH